MAKLTFPAADIAAQARHALAAVEHRPLYDQPDPAPALWLVHDQGVYVMSNGANDDDAGDASRPRPAYAAGCDPDRDPDWWDTGRDLVGGDDFAELLVDGDELARLAGHGVNLVGFTVEVTDDELIVNGVTRP